jgi:hypothetical protein
MRIEESNMLSTIEATINQFGQIVWSDPVQIEKSQKILITFLEKPIQTQAQKTNPRPIESHRLKDEPFIGMWKDRKDMQDSSAWVRSVRYQEWNQGE